MNRSRFNALHAGLNEMAKKVYSAVPAAEPWSTTQITSELGRLRLSFCDFRTVAGCINTLVKTGLVREVGRGTFIRELVKDKPEQAPKEPTMQLKREAPSVTAPTQLPASMPTSMPASSPLDKLSKLSSDLAQIASSLSAVVTAVKSLQTNLDTAALEIEEMFATRDTETDKLRQVLSTLKSLAI